NWAFNELDAYKIRIKTVDTKAFFGISKLPEPTVDPVILQNAEDPRDHDGLSQDVRRFYIYLHDSTKKDQPSYVDDFTHHLLGDLLRFDKPRGITRIRLTLPFIMSGRRVNATASVSVSREDYQIMLVQSDRVSISRDRAEPRLVATALGAFSVDNDKRTANGLAPMSSKMYIGIVTIGSAHFFYKITITQALVDAVANSQFPDQETIIERYIPPVPDIDDFLRDGMMSLDNRRICFQCYEALKTLL
ncbi:hypothetical protein V8E53_006337, partial [Lactarius tabidus]